MIGNKGSTWGILLLIIIMLIMFSTAFWIVEEMRYSWKMYKMIDEHNATCYLERGLFNLPLASICSYEDTVTIEKEERED